MATKALFLIFVAAAMVGMAHGASYTVGAPGGLWDLKTNYTRWASAITFYARDGLRFQYSVVEDNVIEVSKADYDTCNISSPIATYKTGNDVIPLVAAGSRYFICGIPGHCLAGMKVHVNIRSNNIKSKVVRCQGKGSRQRCRSQPSLRSVATSVCPSALAWLSLAAIVVGIVLFF
uniref:Uncharacterized protein n=1 Tax=Avena sativa TaxID=4498 RepID=A0ACD6AG88_AVESA